MKRVDRDLLGEVTVWCLCMDWRKKVLSLVSGTRQWYAAAAPVVYHHSYLYQQYPSLSAHTSL